MSNADPRVLVSVVNWNGGKDLIECLSAVCQSDYSNFDVLVIDNGSKDGSLETACGQFQNIKVIKNTENRGFSGAHNQGIEYALAGGYQLIWILNSDTRFGEKVLEALVEGLVSASDIGMVSPVIINSDDSRGIQFCGSRIDFNSRAFVHFKSLDEAISAQSNDPKSICLWGTALLCRTSVLGMVGGFDDHFFAYYEDFDLSVRVINGGFRNRIVPHALISHSGANCSEVRPPHYVYFNCRNRCIFWRKHLSSCDFLSFLRGYLAGALIQASIFKENGDEEKVNATLQGITDGLRGIGGPWHSSRATRSLLVGFLLRHPYFFADVLRGRLVKRFFRQTH